MSATLERLRAALPEGSFSELSTRDGFPAVALPRAELVERMRVLRDACGFRALGFVTAIDRRGRTPRFELHYQLLSLEHADRLRVRVELDEGDEHAPSVVSLWPGAAFHERECFDMFGIRFDGHEDLRRLYMPPEYEHHPLRKEFPHRGVEPDRLYREWERARRREAAS